MRKCALVLMLFVVGGALATSVQAGTIVTLADIKDIGLASPQTLSAPGSYGYMNADNWGSNGERRMLFQFDLSNIPVNSTVTSAVVRVYRYSLADDTTGMPFTAYRVTSPWTEGEGQSNGGSPNGNGASWQYRIIEGADGIGAGQPGDTDSPIPWTTPGGDYDVSSGVSFTGLAVMDPVAGANWGMMPNVTAIAQTWVNQPGQNYGLIILSNENGYARHAMRTREYGVGENSNVPHYQGIYAPTLVVQYTDAFSSLHINSFLDANEDGDQLGLGEVDMTGLTYTIDGPGGYHNVVTDGASGDTLDGTITIEGLEAVGNYTIVESVPTGYHATNGSPLGTFVQYVNLGGSYYVRFGNNVGVGQDNNPVPEPMALGLMGVLLLALRKR